MSEVVAKLLKVEIIVRENHERIDDMNLKLEEFEEEQSQLCEDFNGAINVVASDASERAKLMESSLLAKIATLEGHVATLVAEMTDLKAEHVALRGE